MRGHRYSDPDRPMGNVHNTQRLLRTRLPLASLLVRETVQNSWDARVRDPGPDTPPVRYSVQGGYVTGTARRSLREFLADPPPSGLPPRESTGASLRDVLDRKRIPTMVVTDQRTVGLDGPSRSDVTASGGRRFVRFLLDMGREPGQALAGGTYGYGKTVLWRASVCSTVVAYSRFREGKRLRSRLMGAGLGDPYVTAERRYTGRHWWGLEDPTVGVQPVEDADADELARALDLPEFPEGDTGTSVMIVGTRLEGRAGLEAVREAARWHCWPKLVPIEGRPDMEFDFLWEEERLPLIDPVQDPELRPLASSLVKVFDGDGEPCKVKRPKVVAGHFAYQLVPRRPGMTSWEGDEDEDAVRPFAGELNHVAWIRRGPRLLVRYEPLPAGPPDPTLRAGGVFVTSDETTKSGVMVENAFALSETPTHDDWSWRDLDRGEEKTIVRTGLARLDDAMRMHLQPGVSGGTATGLVGLAGILGDLIPRGAAPGGDGGSSTGGGGASRRRPLQVREEAPLLAEWDGARWGVLPFTLEGERDDAVQLEAVLSIVDADGATTRLDPDELTEDIYWQQDDGTEYPGWALTVPPEVPVQEWHLWVPVEAERRIRVSVHVRADHG